MKNQKKIGVLILITIIFINQYTWLIFFDDDGFLKDHSKNFFLLIDIILFLIGVLFISYDLKIKLMTFFKKIFLFIYFLFFFEILSFITIKFIMYNNVQKRDQVYYALGEKKIKSKHISYIKSDLRSDYKLNEYSTKINNYGYRSGGVKNSEKIFTIMCVGGSTTFGSGVEDSSDSYPALLEQFLIQKGFDIKVINAGVPYHTSLDVLMRFITKGIYSRPDMLLINTGGNDTGPLNSPNIYKPDYSHWRDVGAINSDNLFKKIWNNYPLSTLRLFILFYLNPGQGSKVSLQSSFPLEELLSETPVSQKRASGLKNYFSSIISLSKQNNIIPITILFNMDHSRNNSLSKRYFKGEELNYAINRKKESLILHNRIMDSISVLNQVKVINFDKFKPKLETSWKDHCHLNKKGNIDKATLISDFVIKNYDLPLK